MGGQAVGGVAMAPGYVGSAPGFAGGIQYAYMPQQTYLPMAQPAYAQPALPQVNTQEAEEALEEVPNRLERFADRLETAAGKFSARIPRMSWTPEGTTIRANTTEAALTVPAVKVPEVPRTIALGHFANITVPTIEKLNLQMPNVTLPKPSKMVRTFREEMNDIRDIFRDKEPHQKTQVAAEQVAPATVMMPVPINSVVPVVSSTASRPAYIAKPKHHGAFFG